MRIFALLISMMLLTSCAKPALRLVVTPESALRQYCWGAHYKKDGVQRIVYFVFNENSEVTFFYYRTILDKSAAPFTDYLNAVIGKDDKWGVHLVVESGRSPAAKFGPTVKEKRVYFKVDGKEFPYNEIDPLELPFVFEEEDEAVWFFEVTKGVELPTKKDIIAPAPRKFMKRQYEKNTTSATSTNK